MLRLTVRCERSHEDTEGLLRKALADNLIALSHRETTTASGKALCTFDAIMRSARVARCQVVALLGQLQPAGGYDLRWESVLDR